MEEHYMTRDDIIKIAQKITGVSFPLGIDGISIGMNEKHLQDFANVIAAAEREACAKVCDGWPDYNVQGLSEAIRARGNHG
jgi:hypothetical protein